MKWWEQAAEKAAVVMENLDGGYISQDEALEMWHGIAEECEGKIVMDGIFLYIRQKEAEARAAYVKQTTYWQNTDTGEVFDTKADAIRDARENYDYGDPTNPIGFDELPYVERRTA